MLHSYASIHGMDTMNLDDPGTSWEDAAVVFDGNKIKKADKDIAQKPHVIFLNYGYVGITSVNTRNSSLVHIIGRNSIDNSTYGFSKSVENVNITEQQLKTKKCESSDSRVDICYMSFSTNPKRRTDAYIVLKGFTPSECSLHYHAAEKNTQGAIKPPVITLNTSGC